MAYQRFRVGQTQQTALDRDERYVALRKKFGYFKRLQNDASAGGFHDAARAYGETAIQIGLECIKRGDEILDREWESILRGVRG